jgi:hypothetical protein
MPFIRGRYHINPIAGEALEAAREIDAALQAQASRDPGSDEREGGPGGYTRDEGKGPIHHVEIESAALVPPHSGRGVQGFVVRVQRHSPVGDEPGDVDSRDGAGKDSLGTSTDTHAFTDHRDLVNFLRDEFAKDCAGKSAY